MKKVLVVLLLVMGVVSCEKDDCKQEAFCQKISVRNTVESVEVCHNGQTISINTNALNTHLEHGDTEGPCQSLSNGGLSFKDGEVVSIDCGYELPFIHTKPNGEQWIFNVVRGN